MFPNNYASMAERYNGDEERMPPVNDPREGSGEAVSSASQEDIRSNENGGSVKIIVKDLLECINKQLDQCPGSNPENNGDDKPYIFRVPEYLHDENKTAYTPKTFSFGPYHHSAQDLPFSESNKLCYIRDANIQKMETILENIWQLKERARSYYSENINMEDKNFVLVLFGDACCLLKAFGALPVTNGIADTETEQRAETSVDIDNSVKVVTRCPAKDVRVVIELTRDLVLLENQVPFFILKKVFEVECPAKEETYVLEKAVEYVRCILGFLSPEMMVPHVDTLAQIKVHHFLHLCHIYISPKQNISETNEEAQIHWRRAVEYREAGVRLKKKKLRHEYSLLDIEFKNGMLLIPCLVIDEKVDFIFRNLLAFEQCTGIANHVTAYITFMSHLVNKPEDVALLCKKGIIANYIGGEEDVTRLFINLSRPLSFDPNNGDYYLKSLSIKLEKSCKNRVSEWMAWLRHNYNHPWLILGALFVLLSAFSTVVQLVKYFISKGKSG
ncbi:hypothetical protein LUZ62_063687 [Rhynchospora pubera]|uniref:Uncharacterized protein n=1 Tax=Rhynchospora pubera TaxID=906938 RepID=A0AAV8EIL6_9POAL|nr:hypothetical protein LUZ62_063687 [Rhynchospora pubera]